MINCGSLVKWACILPPKIFLKNITISVGQVPCSNDWRFKRHIQKCILPRVLILIMTNLVSSAIIAKRRAEDEVVS